MGTCRVGIRFRSRLTSQSHEQQDGAQNLTKLTEMPLPSTTWLLTRAFSFPHSYFFLFIYLYSFWLPSLSLFLLFLFCFSKNLLLFLTIKINNNNCFPTNIFLTYIQFIHFFLTIIFLKNFIKHFTSSNYFNLVLIYLTL